MSSKIKLLSVICPVSEPGMPIEMMALVLGSDNKPEANVKVNWVLDSNYANAKLSTDTSETNEDGRALVNIECDEPGAMKLKAFIDGSEDITAEMKIGFSDNVNLDGPVVPQENNGIVGEDDVREKVQVIVNRRRRVNPDSADTYYLFWGDERIGTTSCIKDADFGSPWGINVSDHSKRKILLSDGVHPVYYYITDEVGNISYSPVTYITVTGGVFTNPIYDELVFPNLKNNIINRNQALADKGIFFKLPDPQTNESAIIRDGYLFEVWMEVKTATRDSEIKVPAKIVHTSLYSKETNSKGYTIEKIHIFDEKKSLFDGVNGYFWYAVYQKDGAPQIGVSEKQKIYIDTVAPKDTDFI